MSEKFFTITEPGKRNRRLSGYISKCHLWDYITAQHYFKRDEFIGSHEECVKYRSELANMLRDLANEIDVCEIAEETNDRILKNRHKTAFKRGLHETIEQSYEQWFMKEYGSKRFFKDVEALKLWEEFFKNKCLELEQEDQRVQQIVNKWLDVWINKYEIIRKKYTFLDDT